MTKRKPTGELAELLPKPGFYDEFLIGPAGIKQERAEALVRRVRMLEKHYELAQDLPIKIRLMNLVLELAKESFPGFREPTKPPKRPVEWNLEQYKKLAAAVGMLRDRNCSLSDSAACMILARQQNTWRSVAAATLRRRLQTARREPDIGKYQRMTDKERLAREGQIDALLSLIEANQRHPVERK